MKKALLTIIFTLSIFAFSAVTYAADSSHCVAPEYLGGSDYCVAGQDYWSGDCHARVTCDGYPGATFNCDTGSCQCPECGTYSSCFAEPSNSCAAENRVVSNACTGTCGSCVGGYVEVGGVCVADCGSGEVRINNVCTEVTYVKYDDPDFYGWNKIDIVWELFLTVNNFVDQMLDELITALTSNADFISNLIDALGLNTDSATAGDVFTFDGTDVSWSAPTGGGAYAPDFVGVSPGVLMDGDLDGINKGYNNADAECVTGHVCTSEEILYAVRNSDAEMPVGGLYWYSSGAPTNPDQMVNDCNGWTTADSGIGGSIWDFTAGHAKMSPCNQFYNFACCN